MRKIYSIISSIILCASVLSCNYLEEVSYTKPDGNTYLTNAAKAETELMAIYKGLGNQAIYGQNLTMIFQLPTDEAKIEGNTLVGARLEGNNAYNASDSYVQSTWQELYSNVYYANKFLEGMAEHMESFSEGDKKIAAVQIAEAKCLRALLYFDLVRWFGNIPLMTSTAQSSQHPTTFKQEDPVKVYEFIEKDLKEAIEVLPYATSDNIRATNDYRFSKGAALGLLAKVYATWAGYPIKDESKWQLVVDTAGELINSGKHGLLPNFEDLWKNSGASKWDPTESLVELSYYAPKATIGMNGYVGKFNGVLAESGSVRSLYSIALYRVVPTFIQEWITHEGDKRCDISYADYRYTIKSGKTSIYSTTIDKVATDITFRMACDEEYPNWNSNWRRTYSYMLFPGKWDTELYVPDENVLVDNNMSNMNWYVLRYADILLLYAEALNEVNHGPDFTSYFYVNQVRRRGYGQAPDDGSGFSDLPLGMSYEEFQAAVRKERSYELAYEGHRRQDLIRWGIYYDTIWNTYEGLASFDESAQGYFPAIQYTRKGKSELLPIPQREIDLCGYTQNPGWN